MTKIECITKDGSIETFQYESEKQICLGRNDWIFRVHPIGGKVFDFFEFSVTQIDENIGKVTMMSHNSQPELIAKGIPERMIEEAYKILELEIISSTTSANHKILENEYITESAVKVWKRLVKRGNAYFDSENKVYRYKP